MKKTLLFIVLICIAFTEKVFSQVAVSLTGFPIVTTGWSMGGSATTIDSTIQLTPSLGGQSGHIYYNTSLNVTACGEFAVDFDYKITSAGGLGVADGIGFFFINPMTGFISGGGLGLPNPLTGFVLTMDTWDNDGDGLNPEDELFGYPTASAYAEGDAVHHLAPILGHQTYMADGSWHHVRITYNGGTIRVYYNGSTTVAMTGTFPITTAGYFGFTASTGAGYSTQSIKQVFITSNTISTIHGTTTICLGSTSALSDSTSGGTWSSSNPAIASVGTTGIVSGVALGTATISYSYGTGCIATTTVNVVTPPVGITGTLTVCAGLTTTLSDATPGGTWSSSNIAVATVGSSTGVVNGVSSGTATITYSTGGSCYVTAVVTVNPSPVVITGSSSVCTGQTITLSDATVGGTWSSSNPAIATVGALTGVVTGISPGTVTITYSLGSCTSTKSVTVNSSPANITGTASICVGFTTTLSDATAGGTWTSSVPAVATISPTGFVNGIAAGTSVIDYTLPGGCFATVTVTVNPLPGAISGVSSICVGDTTFVFDGSPGGTWTSSNIAVATIGSPTGMVIGVSAGPVVLTYTLPTGCLATFPMTINALPAAIVGPTNLCIGQTVTYTDPTVGGFWSSSDPTVAFVLDPVLGTVQGISAGVAVISYSAGCSAKLTVTVNPSPTAITGVFSTCVGSTSPLFDPPGGGTWSSSDITIATIGSTSGIVTGVASGTVTITYTAATGCTVTASFTVNAVPAAIGGPATVCVGLTVTETDATAGGTWTSSNTAVATIGLGTGVATGIAPGVVTISYTLPTGCAATRSFTVNSSPTGITGPGAVCVGSCITELDATGGGLWSIAPTTIATVGSTTGVVCGVAPGIATLTYSLGAGCSTTTIITVNPLPAVVAGALAVCVGSTVTLTDGTLGGTWSSSNIAIATVGSSSGIVTGVAAGTVTITYTLPTGCYRTKAMTVNPLPPLCTVTGGGSYCAGGTGVHIGLSCSVLGVNYQLFNGGVPVGTVVAGTGGPLDFGLFTVAGTYTITGTIAATGCSRIMTGTAVITINPLPPACTVTGGGSYCAGGTGLHVGLLCSTVGVSYQLYNGVIPVGVPILGTGAALDFGLQTLPGTYTVVATYTATGCTRTMTGSVTITINALPTITGPTALCPTATVTLVGTPGPGTWVSSTPAVATITPVTGVVTGVTTGTTTITYTQTSTGCTNTVTVTVSPGPTAIIGPPTVCVGASVTYTDGSPGGSWTSSAPAVATIGSLSGTVLGITPGTTTITYSLGSGCIVTKVITINASPSAITGIFSICVGSTTTLSDPTPGGTWSSVTPGVCTISGGGLVTGVSAGTSVISYTVAGCAATVTETVNPVPVAIGGTLSVCAGQTTTLTDGIPGGTWSSASPGIATIGTSSGIVNGISPGTSVITYSLGSCSKTAIVTVNPLPAAITGTAVVCVGSTTTLADATPGGTWSSATLTVATNVGGVITGVSPGTSVISYTLIATSCATTKTVTVTPVPSAITGSTGVCVGQTTILSDAVIGGTWTSSNPGVATIGSISGIVTGVGPGTSTITYTVGGCSTTTTVNVIASPAAITGPGSVCIGATITLADASPGGTWASSDALTAPISGVGVVTGMSSGTVIITYTLGTSGCRVIKPVVVNPLSPILGTPIVCVGQTTALSDTSLGGIWTSGTPAIATVSPSGIVTGVAGGTTTISYTMPTGCLATIVVTVNPIPALISGSPVICVGQTTALTDATPGGTWTSSSIAVGTISPTGIVSGLAAGTTTISYTLGTTCAVALTVTVNGNPAPIGGPTVVCLGGTITLTNIVPGGMWSSSNTAIATIGSSSGVVNGLTLGTVTIAYTLGTGCNVTSIVNVDSALPPIAGPMSLCVGTTITLTDGTPGGTWSSGSPTVASIGAGTGIVTGNSPGPAVITYSIGTGCTAHATVTVNLIPVGISGATSVCLGQTTTLSDATPGGSWSSSDPTIATIGSSSGIVTGVTVGAVTITYSLGTGCTAMTTVTVNPGPGPILGSPLICLGSTTALSCPTAPPGGTWSSSNPAVAPVSPTGVVSGTALGTATIIFTDGCTSTLVVTVNPLPSAISGNPSVCVGSTTTLSDLIGGGVWSSSDPTIATIGTSSGIVTGIMPGTVTITYSLGAGCVATMNITVNPLPSPIVGPTQVCATQTITLSDATFGGVWSSGAIATATIDSFTGILTGVSGGVATISYTLGCSTTYLVTVNPMPSAISGSGNVCLGGTSALHDAVTGGFWTSSDITVATVGSSSGVVTGVNLGTATITYALGSCYVVKTINVYPLPLVFNVSGGGSYCAGGTGEHVYLSGSTVGVNYLLYRGVTATGTFAGTGAPLDFGLQTVAGTYTVVGTSTATSCSINMADSAVITIMPSVIPAVSININPADSVCAGTSVTFTPIPANGGVTPTYLWDVNGFPVAFSTTYTFIPANGDIVTVTMTSSANCALPPTATGSVTMNVMPYAAPTVSIAVAPNDTVCKGTVVTLTAVPAYGGTAPLYTWMKNGDVAGGSGTYAWIADNGDFVYAIMQSNYPCRTANRDTSSQVVITVDTPIAPIVAINAVPGTMVQVGQTVTLTAVVTGGTTNLTYQWLKNGIPIPSATNATYTSSSYNYPKPDSVTCMVTTNDICTVTGFQWTYINVSNVGVQTLTHAGDISVLPNPNKGEFMIKGSLGTANDEDVSLEITDMLGQVVYKDNIVAKGGKLNEKIVLRSTLANGMYMLTLRSATENKVFHMVIEK